MGRTQRLLRLLGERAPIVDGVRRVQGLDAPLRIARDRWGVPHVRAESTRDAWFGMGFCQGQDRSFQLEFLNRALHGRLSALVGPSTLPLDRLLRRLGLGRSAVAQLEVVDADVRERCEALAAGINAARATQRRPHELALLLARPTLWTAADALGMSKLAAFMLSINWTTKIARQLILERDGPEALLALEPVYAAHHPVGAASDLDFGRTLDRLAESLRALERTLAPRGASNAWALGAARTDTGAALLAADPHVNPALPCFVYLAHLRTPEFSLAGAAFVGGPGIAFGHNGHVAWGATSGLTDTADLYLENLDGPHEVREELIEVRGRRQPVVERVVVTERGPLIGPAFDGEPALSIRAPWLMPRPIRGFLGCERVRTFEELRACFAQWPSAPLNVIGADTTGAVGWQLVGEVPRRRRSSMLPLPSSTDEVWTETIPLSEMPGSAPGPDGVVGSANNAPGRDGEGPWLGADWSTGYRVARIREALREGHSRTPAAAARLQLDARALAWGDVCAAFLAAEPVDADARLAIDLLRGWDGEVTADSAAASLFELALSGVTEAVVREVAPRSFRYAMGGGVNAKLPFHGWAARMCGTILARIADEPDPRLLGRELARAVRRLRERAGPDVRDWGWGNVRPLVLKHPLSDVPGLGKLFDLGPIPWGGDTGTLAMGTPHPLDPFANPIMLPTLRMVVPLEDPDDARFALAGGQSGNPCSPHYDDLLPRFVAGDLVPMPFTEAAVDAATVHTLMLEPDHDAA